MSLIFCFTEEIEENSDILQCEDLTDRVKRGSVDAVLSGSEPEEYYLLKCRTKTTLVQTETENWNASYMAANRQLFR